MDTIIDILSSINVIFYIIAYIAGGIPFGLLISKVVLGTNILHFGSGSTGATNVFRLFQSKNHKYAKLFSVTTIILDALKGLFVVLAAKLFGLSYETQWAIAIFSIIGHCYSPFLGFNGGKGVSTAIGSVFLLMPIEGCLGLVVWAIVGKVFKLSSLSSLVGILTGIALTFVTPYIFDLPTSINIVKQIHTHTPIVLIGLLIFYTHIENIIRLFKGQESKLNL